MTKIQGTQTSQVQNYTSSSKPAPQKKQIQAWDGKFYEGMTAQDAKKKDVYKATFTRDFTDVDKNGDGVLSKEEVLNERLVESKRTSIAGYITTGVGLGMTIVGGLAELPSLGTSTTIMASGSVVQYEGLLMLGDAKALDKETKDLAKENNIDIKF